RKARRQITGLGPKTAVRPKHQVIGAVNRSAYLQEKQKHHDRVVEQQKKMKNSKAEEQEMEQTLDDAMLQALRVSSDGMDRRASVSFAPTHTVCTDLAWEEQEVHQVKSGKKLKDAQDEVGDDDLDLDPAAIVAVKRKRERGGEQDHAGGDDEDEQQNEAEADEQGSEDVGAALGRTLAQTFGGRSDEDQELEAFTVAMTKSLPKSYRRDSFGTSSLGLLGVKRITTSVAAERAEEEKHEQKDSVSGSTAFVPASGVEKVTDPVAQKELRRERSENNKHLPAIKKTAAGGEQLQPTADQVVTTVLVDPGVHKTGSGRSSKESQRKTSASKSRTASSSSKPANTMNTSLTTSSTAGGGTSAAVTSTGAAARSMSKSDRAILLTYSPQRLETPDSTSTMARIGSKIKNGRWAAPRCGTAPASSGAGSGGTKSKSKTAGTIPT
ncbi:unnamed protein product, partial [Amoebophrya sp. A120]